MEELLKNLQDRVTELQTKCNKVQRIIISPIIPFSLFINGPAGEDSAYIPAGKVTQLIVNLIGPKDAILYLNFVTANSTNTEEIELKLGTKLITRTIDITDWTIVRAKIGTEDLTARITLGFNFQPSATFIVSKGVEDAGIGA